MTFPMSYSLEVEEEIAHTLLLEYLELKLGRPATTNELLAEYHRRHSEACKAVAGLPEYARREL